MMTVYMDKSARKKSTSNIFMILYFRVKISESQLNEMNRNRTEIHFVFNSKGFKKK